MQKVKAVLNVGWDTHGISMLAGETQEVEDGIAARMFGSGCAVPIEESVPPPTPRVVDAPPAAEAEVDPSKKTRRKRQKPLTDEE